MTIIFQILAALGLGSLVYLAATTTDKNPALKYRWVFVGFVMFITGILNLVINSVGLYYGFFAWIEALGQLGSFFFKLGLIFGGIAIVVLVTHEEEAYDEYFDGTKYK